MADYIGSSGTLVGTALESLGYYYQSYLLDSLDTVVFGPLAVLLFVITALLFVARYALTGKAKMIGWGIVGPALLAGIIFNRTETKGSYWQFGTQPRIQAQADYEVTRFLNVNTAPKARVSSFFANYTRIVSSVMRNLVAIITETKKDIDARFLIRAELATMVRSSQIEDAGLRVLLHDVFFRECGDLIDAGREVGDKSIPEAERVKRESIFGKSRTPPPGDLVASEQKFTNIETREVEIKDAPKDYIATLMAKYTPLKDYAFSRSTKEIATWIDSSNRGIPGAIPEDDSAQFQTRKVDAIKFIEEDRRNILTCKQVWNFVYIGMYQSASLVSEVAVEKGKGIEQNQLIKDLLQVRTSESPNLPSSTQAEQAKNLHYLNRVIATYTLRNEKNRPSGAAFMNNYANKGFEFTTLKVPTESDLSHLERLRLKSQEWSAKTGIIATAANLPYYQGLVLYLLAVVFPFFALLLVIPGRQNGFIFWCLLWVWVKSWDVGFAVVMLLDDVLFSIFTYWGPTKGMYGEASVGMSPDLADTLSALKTLDPTFQLTTYYSIIGAALASIPMLSSYLILGSVKGGAGIIAEGSKLFASQFAAAAQSGESQPFVTGSKIEAFEDEARSASDKIDGYLNGGQDTSHSPRQSQISSAQGSGAPQNRKGNDLVEHSNERSGATGTAVGASVGKGTGSAITTSMPGILGSSPGAARTMRNFLDMVGGGVQTWGKFESALREAGRDKEAAMLRAHLDVVSSSVPFDTFQEHKIRQMSAESRIYGMLEIPWTQREGGWGASLQKEVTSLTNQMIFEAAPYKAWENVIKGFDTSSKGAMSAMLTVALNANAQKRLGSGNAEDTIVATPLHEGVIRHSNGQLRDNKTYIEFGLSKAAQAGKSSGYVYASNDGVVIYKGKLGVNGQTEGAGTEDVIIVRHRNNTFSFYTGHDGDDALGVTAGKEVTVNDKIGVLKSKDDSLFFRVIDSHFNWLEVKPLLSGLLPLRSEALSDGLASFISNQSGKFEPKPVPYPDQ